MKTSLNLDNVINVNLAVIFLFALNSPEKKDHIQKGQRISLNSLTGFEKIQVHHT
jgi:hypothetical protein